MKKLIILSMALFLSFSIVIGQTVKEEKELIKETKKKIKVDKEKLNVDKKKLKEEEKELGHLEGDDVNYMSRENFISDFGDVSDVKWAKDGAFDRATFTMDGKEKRAYYNFESKLIGTIWNVSFADLPEKGQNEINEQYKDYEIADIVFFDNNEENDLPWLLYDELVLDVDSYFVEIIDGSKKVVLRVTDSGDVSFFRDLE